MIRYPWKNMILLSAISALAIAGYGFAQPIHDSPNGRYAAPDSSESTGTAQESVADRTAQSYLSTLDPESENFVRERERAAAARPQPASSQGLTDLSARSNSTWSSPLSFSLAERVCLAILAGCVLVVSLVAIAYVRRSRAQLSLADATIPLPMRPASAAEPVGIEKQDQPPKRRAA